MNPEKETKNPGPEDPALTHPRGDLNKYTHLQCSGVPPADQVSETDLNPLGLSRS
ncbi:hypothetical protein D1AOALGA4SA_4982 [Olavius algarvensis Delta 1 endosymbiont]|nr:hypothetical protein D1AOALGA4SA_4982 [Olavius algarvensis Delta 1 endosymbiont]